LLTWVFGGGSAVWVLVWWGPQLLGRCRSCQGAVEKERVWFVVVAGVLC